MEKVQIQVEVPKECAELALAMVKVILATRTALSDGFQVGSDIPAIVMASYSELTKAVEGMDLVPAEAKEDPAGVIKAFALAAADIYAALKK